MVYQHASEDRNRLIAERLATMAREAGLVSDSPGPDPSVTTKAPPLGHVWGTKPTLVQTTSR